MNENNFVFADLSTYNLKKAKTFYANVFDWSFFEDNGYTLAYHKDKEICGIYETPDKFKAMNMPSFWMSYIQVAEVEATVNKAKQLGGIIELIDNSLQIGKIALIRDPLGAGFTVYEGNQLNSRNHYMEHALVWNELFISDFSKIQPFYEGVFNWKLISEKGNRYLIENLAGKYIGAIQEIGNTIKGDKEYWSVYFGVKDLQDIVLKVTNNNGKVIYKDDDTVVLEDNQGAFFHATLI